MSAINVVFVGNILYPIGMAGTKRVQNFIDAVCSEPGNTASVLLLRQGHPGRDDANLDGEQDGVPYRTIGADMVSNWRLPVDLFIFLRDGIRWLRRQRSAVAANFLFHYGEPNIESVPLILAARTMGYRVIVDVVEDFYNIGDKAPLMSRLKATSGRFASQNMHWFADAIVVISTYLRDKFGRSGRGRIPIHTIPVAVRLDRVRASGEPFHTPVRVFYAGSFAEKDGVEDLIAAFERVAAKHPAVVLQLTGKGMSERMRAIKARIATSCVADRIHYLGFLSDDEYFDRLCGCDIACVVRTATAFADRGFPFKLGEYLGTGRPVIASVVGDIPAFLTDRVSAFLVDAGSVEQIEQALHDALSDPDQALSIGARGRAIAEQNFDAVANGRLILDVFNRMSQDKARA